jgi:hypothetical protein
VPVRVLLPADPILHRGPQEVVARLYERRQTPDGWLYLVGLPAYRNTDDGGVEAAEYRVWVHAPHHVRPIDGVDYDQVPTERIERTPQETARENPRPAQAHRMVRQTLRDEGSGPARHVIHAPDCEEAPDGAPALTLEKALNAAEQPGTRLCSLSFFELATDQVTVHDAQRARLPSC